MPGNLKHATPLHPSTHADLHPETPRCMQQHSVAGKVPTLVLKAGQHGELRSVYESKCGSQHMLAVEHVACCPIGSAQDLACSAVLAFLAAGQRC